MTSRERILGGLLVLAALGFTAMALRAPDTSPSAIALSAAKLTPEFQRELAQYREAESITDFGQRCLAYPDPVEFGWNRPLVEMYCQVRAVTHISREEIKQALDQNRPEQLETAFSEILESNFSDPRQRGRLIRAYRKLFQDASPEVHDSVERWVAAAPNSAYARAARGTHYVATAQEARGGNSLANTPAENLTRMRQFLDLARPDLEQAMRDNPRLIAAHDAALYAAKLIGDGAATVAVIQAALAVDPTDERIYFDLMGTVEPRWGGSIAQMNEVADTAMPYLDKNPLLALLRVRPIAYQAWRRSESGDGAALAQFDAAFRLGPDGTYLQRAGQAALNIGDMPKAVRYYSQAWRFLNSEEVLVERARALHAIGETAWALRDLDTAVARKPRDAKIRYAQAYLLDLIQRPQEAVVAYAAVVELEPHNEAAQYGLGRQYVQSLAEVTKGEALAAAMLQHNPQSPSAWKLKTMVAKANKDDEACRQAVENYLQFVNHSDANEQSDIAIARAHLKSLQAKRQ